MFPGGYHIILIPKNADKTKRIHLSTISARLLLIATLLIVPIIVTSLFFTVHYQNKVEALKQSMSEEKLVLEQKEALANRLSTLEKSINHTDQTISKLETALDGDVGQMSQGTGPVDEETLKRMEIKVGNEPRGSLELDNMLDQGEAPTLTRIRTQIGELGRKSIDLQNRIDEMYDLHEDKIRFLEATPNSFPVEGWVTSGFGFRHNPYSGGYKMHYGLDIASPIGTPVKAPADGSVLWADYSGGYGRKLVIEHGYGVVTVYAHASEFFVKQGDKIKKGQVIASVGSTGNSTGPHLHYEVYVDGIPTDPLNYIIH